MIVIGIDPGTATTGYGIVDEDEAGTSRVIDYGVVLTQAGLPQEIRLQTLFTEIAKIISLHRPESGAVEKLFFQRNVTTALAVGQARGVILLALATQGVKVYEYTPTEIKSAVTGYGAADKHQVQTMVSIALEMNEIPRPDDAADALVVALCHIHSVGYTRLAPEETL